MYGAISEGADRESKSQDVIQTFSNALRLHRGLVRAYLRQRMPYIHEEDLQDLEQDVWMAVWKSLESYAQRAALGTWIIGITKNVMCSWLRDQHREKLGQLRERVFIQECDHSKLWGEDFLPCIVARDALAQLPWRERTVLGLRYFEGLSDQEIARTTGLKLGTVKGRIRSGLSNLRAVV